MKVLVIGTGFGARVVAPVFAETPGCWVGEVVSARDSAAITAAIRAVRPDLVSVHSPPFLHSEHVRLALAAGVAAVMCDKPFATSVEDSEALLAEANSAGTRHFVNFEFRCDPAREKVRALIADGAVGKVTHLTWVHHSSGSRVPMRRYGWLFDAARGGGWIGAWGSHAVDNLRWMLNDEVGVEWTRPRTSIRERVDEAGVQHRCTAEDGLTAALVSQRDRVTVVVDSSFAAAANPAPRCTTLGSEGVIENVADERIVLRRVDGSQDVFDFRTTADGDRHLVPMRRWAQRVRDAVVEGVSPPGLPTFADGVACDRVLALLRASGSG